MKLTNKYKWLLQVADLPWVIAEGLKEYGVFEWKGAENNPKILAWADEVGGWERNYYTKDSIPWCGLYVAVIAKRAKKEVVKNYLRAMSWANFGKAINPDQAGLGDVLVFSRNGGGHVGFYIAEDKTHYHVLGGNQSDQVNIRRIAKSRLYSVNRPNYRNQPKSVEPLWVAANGIVSNNEA